MACVKENCPCPKTSCSHHGKCCECVPRHKSMDGLPFCLFEDNDGDKSLENFYKKLKERFK